MRQEAFEKRHGPSWVLFERWIDALSAHGGRGRPDFATEEAGHQDYPSLYRKVCHHLALARTRRYSIGLQQRLNQLVLDGHRHLYRTRTPFIRSIGQFLSYDFPFAFRKHWRYILASTMLFYLPAAGMSAAIVVHPELVFALLEPHQVASMEDMYQPENDVLGRPRESSTDIQMFGFYIYNNISIGFQTFAGGLLFGIGSLFYLIFNGLYLGAVSTHLLSLGYSETFLPFVAGHSAFELTAITIFGGVGLIIGYCMIAPGRKRRWQAVRDRSREAMPLIYGATLMLVAAAFVEAFWSSTTWPPISFKYTIGLALWLCHGLYFGLLGRNES